MALHNTRGIILTSRIINDSDVTAEILTEKNGLSTFFFKSIKKSHRRPQAILETGTAADFSFYQRASSNSAYISSYSITFHPSVFSSSFEQIISLHLMAEIILKTTGHGIVDSYIYSFMLKALETLVCESTPKKLIAFFLLHLMKHNGILPNFSENIVLTFGNTCHLIDFTGIEMNYIHSSLNNRYDRTIALDNDSASKLSFSLLLYIEHYYSIMLNSKKILFSEMVVSL
jgi:recombinational DNA repair protein (RecF pathway)